jgi:hypothetical protein
VKVHSFDQYSEDWWRVRSGLPSASCADKLLTPTGKPSAQAKAYIASLLADELGYRDEDVSTAWMERGLEMEEEAIAMLELQQDLDTQACGLITNDDVTACCSPDAVVCVDGEIVAGVQRPTYSTCSRTNSLASTDSRSTSLWQFPGLTGGGLFPTSRNSGH